MILTYGLALNKMTLVVLYPLSISMDGHDIRHEDFSDFYAFFFICMDLYGPLIEKFKFKLMQNVLDQFHF